MKTLCHVLVVLLIFTFLLSTGDAKTKQPKKKKVIPCTEGTSYRDCRACGTASLKSYRDLNVLKNRDDAATSPQEVKVTDIRKASNDQGHFAPDQQVWVRGYVASLDKGGFEESCNCGRDDLRDIHINIVANASERNDKTKFVVVEITPRWQQKFSMNDSDYDAMLEDVKAQILHKFVKFEGWMLYDIAHVKESESTAKDGTPVCKDVKGEKKPCIWRATPWEVHPVTKYTVE